MKKRAFMNFCLLLTLLAAAVVMGIFSLRPNVNAEQVSYSRDGLVINEIMAKNSSAVASDDGGFYDWIELYNGGSLPISLGGLSLSDKDTEPGRFPLPDIILDPGQYAVVWCSGLNKQGPPMHAGFRISVGETIGIYTSSQDVIDSVTISAAVSNHVYARQLGGAFIDTAEFSPGYENTSAGHQSYLASMRETGDSPLKFNEIMSANRTAAADLDGEYSDWIELVNTGSETVDLTGFALSDNEAEPKKWVFSSGSVRPGETYLVFASGKDLKGETPPHTSFRLSASGETALLYNAAGKLVDRVEVPELKDDESYFRDTAGDWERTYESTPGLPNDDDGRTEAARRIIEQNEGLYIAKAVAGNVGSLVIGSETPDWVEIVNRTGTAVDLSGYGLSNRTARPLRWQFPQGTAIENGERLVIALAGAEIAIQTDEYLSADFALSLAGGDFISLANSEGNVLDKIAIPVMRQEIAIGRDENRTGLFYFSDPKPGEPNENPMRRLAHKPEFETAGGVVSSGTVVRMKAAEGFTLRYTTDFTEPTSSSPEFPGEMTINQTTVLRVAAFGGDAIPSITATATYLVGESHSLPIVSLVTDPKNLFDHNTGIWANGPGYKEAFPHGSRNSGANFWMDWEKPIHVEIFGIEGVEIAQNAGIRNNGQYSRAQPQKSVSIYARSKYEKNTFDGPLFENRDYEQVRAFVLRATGQDNNRSRMRDAVLTSLAKDTGVMHQDTQIAIVYVNGEYWGHYNIRERVNKNSVAQWEGIPLDNTAVIDNIDIIKGNSRVLNGSGAGYQEIIDFVKKNSLKNEENLKWVTDRVDVLNYFDYQAMEIIIGNSDNGNIKFYNTNLPGSKWKWILYDVDWAYNYSGNITVAWDTLSSYLDPRGTGVGRAFENALLRSLIENTEMRNLFIERLAYHLNNTYAPERVNATIDEYVAAMAPEMERHYAKWAADGSVASWEKHIGRMRSFANERPDHMKKHIKDYFKLSDSEMAALFGG